MFYLIRTMQILVIIIVLVLALSTWHANAYTYDSSFDPAQFFEYEFVSMQDIGGNRHVLMLKSEDHVPRYVVQVVTVTRYRQILILTYSFYDNDGKIQNYALDPEKGHYYKKQLSENSLAFVKERLDKLMNDEVI